MSISKFNHYPSYTAFLAAYNQIETLYLTYKNTTVPINDEEFTTPFFYCYDYLSSLKKEDLDLLKSDLNMHCKITMYDTIKLDLVTKNPSLMKIPGILRFF